MGVNHKARRRFLKAAACLLAGHALPAFAQKQVRIADMHSHYGMVTRRGGEPGFADDMRASGVALVAWKHIADGRWIRAGSAGIEQSAEPAAGALAQYFNDSFDRMKGYIARHKLRTVLAPADVDACVAGDAGIVLASEGADFLEGRLEPLGAAYDKGLRHLQFVHYIRTPVGDFQTSRPTHDGMSAFGKQLVEACNSRGILVDLAHSSGEALDQVLDIAKAPIVWSHGWVDSRPGSWRDATGFMARRLSIDQAKKIAAKGGVVGLWALGVNRAVPGWTVAPGNPPSYARALADLVDRLGADHVALGTDIEGVGPNWAVNSYAHARAVIDALEQAKLSPSVIERVACGNYARVLKETLKA
jgi:membrane dipeptidase